MSFVIPHPSLGDCSSSTHEYIKKILEVTLGVTVLSKSNWIVHLVTTAYKKKKKNLKLKFFSHTHMATANNVIQKADDHCCQSMGPLCGQTDQCVQVEVKHEWHTKKTRKAKNRHYQETVLVPEPLLAG